MSKRLCDAETQVIEQTDNEKNALTSRYHRAPIRMWLAALAFFNWFIHFGLSMTVGGNALGTTPSVTGFVVTDHGKTTPVSESQWLLMLIHPFLTFTITPILIFSLMLAEPLDYTKRPVKAGIIFGALWALGWYYIAVRDIVHSLSDYFALHS